MTSPEHSSILDDIRSVMHVESFGSPADPHRIDKAGDTLDVIFPDWLRAVYLACDGFCGPTGVQYLYPLEGRNSVLSFNQFARCEDWAPTWIERAIVFGDNGIGGTITVHWAVLDGQLIEWCLGDGEEYTPLDSDVFALWRREQALWDEIGNAPEQ